MSKEDKKRIIDWERIELDYRSGIKTLREIAEEHGISHGAVNKKAKKEGWPRDLAPKIREKAALLVSKEAVSKEVSKEKLATEKEVIEANAQVQANIVIGHRKDIQRGRALTMRLLEEIESQTDDPELFQRLGVLMASPDEKGVDKLSELYMKVIGTPSRIDSMKKLGETLKNLIALEREAFGLDAGIEQEKPIKQLSNDELAERINGMLNKVRGFG